MISVLILALTISSMAVNAKEPKKAELAKAKFNNKDKSVIVFTRIQEPN
ncbi:MAG: hypothetical protein ACUVWN_06105 [bacterium]